MNNDGFRLKFDIRKSDLSKVKVGDWLYWLMESRWIKVVTVIEQKYDDPHPIRCMYKDWAGSIMGFMIDGKRIDSNTIPVLFTDCPFFDGPPKPIDLPYRPDFEVDHKVWVARVANPQVKGVQAYHFARWPKHKEDSGIHVFQLGRTSHSQTYLNDTVYASVWGETREECIRKIEENNE